MLEEISPRSVNLQRSIKAPMIFMTWTCGLMTATNLVLIKCFGEIIKAQEFGEMPLFASACFFFGVLGCFVMLYVLNVAMRYYDNIDVIPIY